MEPSEEGTVIVFSANTMPEGFSLPRLLRVETVVERVHGYRVPEEALVTLTSDAGESVTGVYILAGNVVEFRKLSIIAERKGYVIAATYEEIKAAEEAQSSEGGEIQPTDGWSYLRLNDKIITRGTGLYEGKMIS